MSIRERYEAYREAVERETYRFRSGQRSSLELEEIDDRFGDVTGGGELDELDSRAESGFTSEEREGSQRLGNGVRSAVVDAKLRRTTRELCEREAAYRFRVDREERTLYAWQVALGAERQTEQRERIQRGLESAWAELNPLREESFTRRAEALRDLGFETGRHWCEALHPGVDYPLWRRHAEVLLERTEAVYRDAMSKGLTTLGVDPGGAHPGDAAALFRWVLLDRLFPASRLVEALDFTTEGMRIRLADVPGVSVDAEPRPSKHPRACCVAPSIPGEVHVLFHPRGGVQDYESLFHEAGHALHFGFTSAALPVERRCLFDPALTETWAFLLHYRISDPEWLATSPASGRADEVVAGLRLEKLFLLRRYASKVLYELELVDLAAGESPRPLAGRYAEELGRGTGLRYGEAGYLVDTDPDLYAVDYLRAWCLEAQLVESLRERFGRRFWKTRG
ncbi:MAG: hypothetical protein V3T14_07330, partial [Myxococcota bacterium]